MLNNLISYFSPKIISVDNSVIRISETNQTNQTKHETRFETNHESIGMNAVIDEFTNTVREYHWNNCNHDFVQYNQTLLTKISNELDSRRNNQIDRIFDKILNKELLNELDTKILDLLIKWYPASAMVHGKCMICNKEIVVSRIMNKDIIYV